MQVYRVDLLYGNMNRVCYHPMQVPTSDKDTEVAMETEKSSIEGGAGGKEGMAVRSKGSRLDKGNNASVSMKPRTMVAKKYSRKKRKH